MRGIIEDKVIYLKHFGCLALVVNTAVISDVTKFRKFEDSDVLPAFEGIFKPNSNLRDSLFHRCNTKTLHDITYTMNFMSLLISVSQTRHAAVENYKWTITSRSLSAISHTRVYTFDVIVT